MYCELLGMGERGYQEYSKIVSERVINDSKGDDFQMETWEIEVEVEEKGMKLLLEAHT